MRFQLGARRGGRKPAALCSPRHRGAARVALYACAALALVPAAVRGGSAPDGHALYVQRCARCHGPSGHGDGPDAALCATKPPDLRAGFIDPHRTDQLVQRVLDGGRLTLALDVPALRGRAGDVESLVAHMQRLPDVDWRKADAGSAIYSARCELCHGVYGHPGTAPPPGVRTPRDLSEPSFQRATSDADLVTAVRHGRAGMPALTPRLSEEQAVQVAAFVRLLSPGFTTYAQYCAGCHGDHGIGAGSFAESYRAPTVVFDRAYFARADPEVLRGKAWHMLDEHQPSMPHFRGSLSAAQARAIVRYLEKSAPTGR
jgi:mono/diheme cytochrome c family protein